MHSKDFEAAAVSLSDNWKPVNGYYDLRPNWFSPSIARVFWETDDLKQKWASIAQGLTNGIRRGADNLTDAFEYGADKPVFGGQRGPQCDSTILSTGRAGPKEVDMDKSIKLKSRKEEVRLKIGYASSAGPDRPKAALDTASQDASAMTG
ncbi:unnamed protein product [Sordaria macrospora k-hell]|uniref:WGS project CABT00000000 data, contig 2.15 n=1 Tax=Sordaria macrospora (strain ATCC MYA-333 / DSM 997 / K(L3346) / K-hell) TaxID=771870 RepID=F7VZM7_SORMK|nr:uncharacterized protein SMAC_04205 [Sordaria macrospora k-hell]CCC10976.1 unnamed protein product [Sordaria macrospora k-hell]